MIEPSLWSKLHGASTHFPIALMLVSTLCETAACFFKEREIRQKLQFAGMLTIVLGALGSYGAVLSGLVVAKWRFWGHATLLRHHQFVWPAFALMTGLASWRLIRRGELSGAAAFIYLSTMFLAAGLVGLAGYWGGELLNLG